MKDKKIEVRSQESKVRRKEVWTADSHDYADFHDINVGCTAARFSSMTYYLFYHGYH